MRRRNKGQERDVALQRVRRLIEMAHDAIGREPARADRYVALARRIAMRYQVSMPRELRRFICRACDGLLVPGRTARVRLSPGRLSITCLRCGTVRRYPIAAAREVPV